MPSAVRLVRACGSKHIKTSVNRGINGVRLVRALFEFDGDEKSIWVRLVRACGSKLLSLQKKLSAYTVRLVRACGSKPYGRNFPC